MLMVTSTDSTGRPWNANEYVRGCAHSMCNEMLSKPPALQQLPSDMWLHQSVIQGYVMQACIAEHVLYLLVYVWRLPRASLLCYAPSL